jgi:hypothetical protein
MSGFAIIMENLDRKADALEVYEAVLALHPTSADVQEAADRLKLELEGQAL